MTEELLTTFPAMADFERAENQLKQYGLEFLKIEPPAYLHAVAIPAMVVTREVRHIISEKFGERFSSSGWVDFRESSPSEIKPYMEQAQGPFVQAAISVLQACVADEEKLRFIAQVQGDLEQVFPYMNAIMPQASFSPQAKTFTFMDGCRMVVLYPHKITAAKTDDITDCWRLLYDIRAKVNDTWSNRDGIEPCFTTRKKPPALEIFKRLPGTNCGRCEEITCMAFAMRLWSGETSLEKCTELNKVEYAQLYPALVEICAGLGIDTKNLQNKHKDLTDGRSTS